MNNKSTHNHIYDSETNKYEESTSGLTSVFNEFVPMKGSPVICKLCHSWLFFVNPDLNRCYFKRVNPLYYFWANAIDDYIIGTVDFEKEEDKQYLIEVFRLDPES